MDKPGWVGPKLTRSDVPSEFNGGAMAQSRGIVTLLSQLHTNLAEADSIPGLVKHTFNDHAMVGNGL